MQEIVAAADARSVKLGIQLTPQWVDMIKAAGNEWMLEAFQGWRSNGHDFGGHHHQIDHDAAWDGYSNVSTAVSSTRDPGYLGNLADHLVVIQRLVSPAAITNYSGGEPDDYPIGIPILFHGGQTEGTQAAAIQPERVDYNGLPAWYMSMASLIVFGQPDNDALEQLYLITPSSDYFGVATHADNWLTSSDPIVAWFDFLQEQDPEGQSIRTLSQILSELPALE